MASNNALRDLAEAIAVELGSEWKRSTRFDADDKDNLRPWRIRLEGPNEQTLFLSNTWGKKGSLYVGGWIPARMGNANVGAMPSINVGLTKTPAQIAKDISRRLLPEYVVKLAEVIQKFNADQDYKQRTETTKQQVAEVISGRINGNAEIVYGSGSADIQICGPDSLRFAGHCFYFNIEQLKKIRAAVPELFTKEDTSGN